MRNNRYIDQESHGEAARGHRKAESHALRELAGELAAMVPARLAKLGLPDDLARAIAEAQRLTSLPAKNRQLNIVRKLLEGLDDEEVASLRFRMTRVDHVAARPERDPLAERAEALLDGGDDAVFALADTYGREALQPLRQTVRAAKKKVASGLARDAAVAAVRESLAALGSP